eukprot:COSAG01_NODE_35991_length_524_cov_0.602353_1_plen_110_part_00
MLLLPQLLLILSHGGPGSHSDDVLQYAANYQTLLPIWDPTKAGTQQEHPLQHGSRLHDPVRAHRTFTTAAASDTAASVAATAGGEEEEEERGEEGGEEEEEEEEEEEDG